MRSSWSGRGQMGVSGCRLPIERGLGRRSVVSRRRNDSHLSEDWLAERRGFIVAGDRWDRLAVALDRPAVDVPGLVELMNEPTVLDEAAGGGRRVRCR